MAILFMILFGLGLSMIINSLSEESDIKSALYFVLGIIQYVASIVLIVIF